MKNFSEEDKTWFYPWGRQSEDKRKSHPLAFCSAAAPWATTPAETPHETGEIPSQRQASESEAQKHLSFMEEN